MKVTVCELPDDPNDFAAEWHQLQAHVHAESCDLLVLNEAPFDKWFALEDEFSNEVWNTAVANHETAISELRTSCAVIATAPINQANHRYNRSFSWTLEGGALPWRRKAFVPDEESVYEATWYEPAPDQPDIRTIAGTRAGILTCTEIWKMDWADQLGQLGAQLIATPRATGDDSLDKWHAAGRVAAICSGAFSVSSNRVGNGFGGGGWIFSPDGDFLAGTDADQPFVTAELDLTISDLAKGTYPRYALWRSA